MMPNHVFWILWAFHGTMLNGNEIKRNSIRIKGEIPRKTPREHQDSMKKPWNIVVGILYSLNDKEGSKWEMLHNLKKKVKMGHPP